MGAAVKPDASPHILTGDEWESAQYGPQRVGQDPTKPAGPGRILTGDEWEKARAAASVKPLTFPALPKIAPDVTATRPQKPAETLPGQYDTRPTPEQQAGSAIRNVSGALDVAAGALPSDQAVTAHALAATGRQVLAPAVENPAMTAATFNPIGAVVGAGMAVHTIAKYGWQQAHEAFLSPEDKAKAEADPDHVSGEAAAVQAIMLGLGGLVGVKGLRAGETPEAIAETAPHFETPKGAETLGTAAAAHGMPETASPYQPETPLDQAWKQGHAATTEAAKPAEPVAAETSAVTPGATAPAVPTGLTARTPTQLYAKLSDDALSAQYRDLIEKRTAEQPTATPPLWTPEREAAEVEAIENRRKPDGSFSAADKRALDMLQLQQGEGYYTGRHTTESAAAERRLAVIDRHIATIEQEMQGRGIRPEDALATQPGAAGGLSSVEGTGATKTRGLALGVEQKAIAKDLTDYLGDLPEYRQVNMADQAARSLSLLNENPDLARRVALGEARAPEGVIPEAVFTAVENRAIEHGDVATIRDLASSKLTEEATTMGQRIRALRDRDPDSPVTAIQRIEESRGGGEGAAKAISDAVTELKDHVAQGGMIDEGMWSDFINSLRC